MKTGDLVMLALVGAVGYVAYELYSGNWSFAGMLSTPSTTTSNQQNTVVANGTTPTNTSNSPNSVVTNIIMPTRAVSDSTTPSNPSGSTNRGHR